MLTCTSLYSWFHFLFFHSTQELLLHLRFLWHAAKVSSKSSSEPQLFIPTWQNNSSKVENNTSKNTSKTINTTVWLHCVKFSTPDCHTARGLFSISVIEFPSDTKLGSSVDHWILIFLPREALLCRRWSTVCFTLINLHTFSCSVLTQPSTVGT